MKKLDNTTVQELQQRLRQLQPGTAAQWGRMNARQMVCHLSDAMGLAMGKKTASEVVTFWNRTFIRWIALHTSMPWPKGVPTRPEFDQFVAGTKPGDFAKDTAALSAALERFAHQPRDFHFGRHPVFGELTEQEWMRWAYRHADHHFRQFGI
ncbi:MAG: DUF1569 domain-containing protein [Bryobacteraceae bacterium]